MQQQVDSYKHAIRDWDEQQQRHRAAIEAQQQQQAAQNSSSSGNSTTTAGNSTTPSAAPSGGDCVAAAATVNQSNNVASTQGNLSWLNAIQIIKIQQICQFHKPSCQFAKPLHIIINKWLFVVVATLLRIRWIKLDKWPLGGKRGPCVST